MTLEEALQKKNAVLYREQSEAMARLEQVCATLPEYKTCHAVVRSFPARMLAIYKDKKDLDIKLAALKAELDEANMQLKSILTSNGYPENYCDTHYECEKCRDTGYVGSTVCVCVKRMMSEVNYTESGIGKALLDKTFDNFSLDAFSRTPARPGEQSDYDYMSSSINQLKQYAAKFPEVKSILLFGATGLGKTHISAAIAKEVISRGFSAHYDTAPAIFACFDAVRFGRREPDATNKYFDCDLLVLDDLGAENPSAQNVSVLFQIVNTRILTGKKTIISTNLTSAEIKKIYGDRIASRLMGEYLVFRFVGKDMRAQRVGV